MKYDMRAGDMTITIGILARDCAKALHSNIPLVEEVGRFFKDYDVIVYENDSKDDTKSVLTEWQHGNHRVLAIMEDTPKKEHIRPVEVPFPDKSIFRIQRMALCRNRILEEVRKRPSPDLFCFIDIDIEKFFPESVVQAIENAPADWGALFANGAIYMKSDDRIFPYFMQYDSYAYVDRGVDPRKSGTWFVNKRFHPITACRMNWKIKHQDYLPCHSAFNGLGIYKWRLIKDQEYSLMQTPELEKLKACMCEHIPFNMGIIGQGYVNYIVQGMKVVYWYEQPKRRKAFGRWKNRYPALYYFLIHHKTLALRLLIHTLRERFGMFPYQRMEDVRM